MVSLCMMSKTASRTSWSSPAPGHAQPEWRAGQTGPGAGVGSGSGEGEVIQSETGQYNCKHASGHYYCSLAGSPLDTHQTGWLAKLCTGLRLLSSKGIME